MDYAARYMQGKRARLVSFWPVECKLNGWLNGWFLDVVPWWNLIVTWMNVTVIYVCFGPNLPTMHAFAA